MRGDRLCLATNGEMMTLIVLDQPINPALFHERTLMVDKIDSRGTATAVIESGDVRGEWKVIAEQAPDPDAT